MTGTPQHSVADRVVVAGTSIRIDLPPVVVASGLLSVSVVHDSANRLGPCIRIGTIEPPTIRGCRYRISGDLLENTLRFEAVEGNPRLVSESIRVGIDRTICAEIERQILAAAGMGPSFVVDCTTMVVVLAVAEIGARTDGPSDAEVRKIDGFACPLGSSATFLSMLPAHYGFAFSDIRGVWLDPSPAHAPLRPQVIEDLSNLPAYFGMVGASSRACVREALSANISVVETTVEGTCVLSIGSGKVVRTPFEAGNTTKVGRNVPRELFTTRDASAA